MKLHEAIEEIYLGSMISKKNEEIIREIHQEKYPHSKLERNKMLFSLDKVELK